jgi:hypothetical protein
MTHVIPTELQKQINEPVLGYLQDKSAHSDATDALRPALKPLGDVQVFCPDWQSYRYVVASTRGIIFAVALGMNVIGFRLDRRMKGRALVCGATPISACGDEWVSFEIERDDWPRVDLEFWARKAYVAARELED